MTRHRQGQGGDPTGNGAAGEALDGVHAALADLEVMGKVLLRCRPVSPVHSDFPDAFNKRLCAAGGSCTTRCCHCERAAFATVLFRSRIGITCSGLLHVVMFRCST